MHKMISLPWRRRDSVTELVSKQLGWSISRLEAKLRDYSFLMRIESSIINKNVRISTHAIAWIMSVFGVECPSESC